MKKIIGIYLSLCLYPFLTVLPIRPSSPSLNSHISVNLSMKHLQPIHVTSQGRELNVEPNQILVYSRRPQAPP